MTVLAVHPPKIQAAPFRRPIQVCITPRNHSPVTLRVGFLGALISLLFGGSLGPCDDGDHVPGTA